MSPCTSTHAFTALLDALGLAPIDELPEDTMIEADNYRNPYYYADEPLSLEQATPPFSPMDLAFSEKGYSDEYEHDKELEDLRIDVWSDFESEDESIDAYFHPSCIQRPESSCLGDFECTSSSSEHSSPTSFPTFPLAPLSPTFSITGPKFDAGEDYVQIKAAFNATIILLRVPRDHTLAQVKHRIYEKFAKQESVCLSHTTSIIFVSPSSQERSKRSKRISFADRTEMRFVDNDREWRRIADMHNGSEKITLRIVDPPL